MASTTVLLALAVLVAALLYDLLLRQRVYLYKARKKGCGVPMDIASDFPFGIRGLIRSTKNARRHRLVEGMLERMASFKGLTSVRQGLSGTFIVTADPANYKSIFASDFASYGIGFRRGALLPFVGDGIFAADGAWWKHSRAMLRPIFARDKVSRLHMLGRHFGDLVAHFKRGSQAGDGFVNAQDLYQKYVVDSATELLFGQSLNELGEGGDVIVAQTADGPVSRKQMTTMLGYVAGLMVVRIMLGPLYWLGMTPMARKATGVINSFADRIIKESQERFRRGEENTNEKAPGDYYSMVDDLVAQGIEPRVIRDQVWSVFAAARDTTSALLTFSTLLLAQHPDVWHKLRREVFDTFGNTLDDPDTAITFESLKRATYVNHVLNETLRVMSPVPANLRVALRDTSLPRGAGPSGDEPVFVPKGTTVLMMTQYTHKYKPIWGDDADEFRPERWQEGSSLRGWSYVPFGGGPRICLGQQIALTESAYTLVRLAYEFEQIIPSPQLAAGNIRMRSGISLQLLDGLSVHFK